MDLKDELNNSAPPHKCFYFWAVHPKNWPYIAVAVQLLEDIEKMTYRKPKSGSPEHNRKRGVSDPGHYFDKTFEEAHRLTRANNSRSYHRERWIGGADEIA